MKRDCMKWKDELLEAALGRTGDTKFYRHLEDCRQCAHELETLRLRQSDLERLLPLLVQEVEPGPEFLSRIRSAIEVGSAPRPLNGWLVATAAAALVCLLIIASARFRRVRPSITSTELATAEALAQWRAPTDELLNTPVQEFLPKGKRSHSSLTAPPRTGGKE